MKQFFIIALLFLFSCSSVSSLSSETVDIKTFAEEAMKDSIIDNNPVIIISQISSKIYSKTNLSHQVFKKIKRKNLFIIPKNSDLTEEFGGITGKENGIIVYKSAQEFKPDLKKLRYVIDGKEIIDSTINTLNLKNFKDYVCLKNNENQNCVLFIAK